MGSVVSVRRSRAGGEWAPGLLSRWWRGRRVPPEVPLSSPETPRRNLEALPRGAVPARRRRRREPRPPPSSSSSLGVAGDGGEWEETDRHHRRVGSPVSSAQPVEELLPFDRRGAPRDQAQGPPVPLRYLACARTLGERHPRLHLPPYQDGHQQDG